MSDYGMPAGYDLWKLDNGEGSNGYFQGHESVTVSLSVILKETDGSEYPGTVSKEMSYDEFLTVGTYALPALLREFRDELETMYETHDGDEYVFVGLDYSD